MPEELNLEAPHQARGGTNRYRIKSLTFLWLDNDMVKNPSWSVELVGDNQTLLAYTETDPVQAETDLVALNKTDLSVKSLQKRLFEVLVARAGLPVGSIVGVPD